MIGWIAISACAWERMRSRIMRACLRPRLTLRPFTYHSNHSIRISSTYILYKYHFLAVLVSGTEHRPVTGGLRPQTPARSCDSWTPQARASDPLKLGQNNKRQVGCPVPSVFRPSTPLARDGRRQTGGQQTEACGGGANKPSRRPQGNSEREELSRAEFSRLKRAQMA